MSDLVERMKEDYRRKELSPEPTRVKAEWENRDGYEERRVVIVYPRASQFIIDRLEPHGWVEVVPRKEQDTEERAIAQAQSLANSTGIPHSVREVIVD